MERRSFKARFLKLTLFGYVVALLTVAVAVLVSSQPVLREMHLNEKRAHLETKSRVVSDYLDEWLAEGRFLAQSPEVVSYLKGVETLEAFVLDRLGDLGGAKNVRLIDVSGRELLSPGQGRAQSAFQPVEALSGLSAMVDGLAPAEPSMSFRPGVLPHTAEFLFSIPVIADGQVRGILSFEVEADLSATLRPDVNQVGTRLATTFQVANWEAWYGEELFVAIAVDGQEIYLIMDDQNEALQNLGRELVLTAIGMATVALTLPFGLMALTGQRAIVQPHRDLQRSQEILAQSQSELSELAQIAEMAAEAVTVTDGKERIIWVNSAFQTVSGYSEEEAVGRRPQDFLQGPETSPQTRRRIREALSQDRPAQVEILNYHKDGSEYWVNLSISPLKRMKGGERRYAAIATDITASKTAQAELERARVVTEHQSRHDALTGLPNRRYLDHILDTEARESDMPRTLIRVDLDHFKNVNDTLGHAAGDHVLREVAGILGRHCGPGDMAARVGGDEFVILLAAGRDANDAYELTEILRQEVKVDMEFDGKLCRVGASFGISSAANGLIGNGDLLKSADAALYMAKEEGRNTTTLYTAQIHRAVKAKRKLSVEIEAGLKRDEFKAYFQPQFAAESGRFVGVEALVRWHHPTRGVLAPAEFLRVAEQLRLLPDIDKQVFDYGLKCVAALNADGLEVPKISFNVGMHQLFDTPIDRLIGTVDIGRTKIALEILESVLIEEQNEDFMFRINRLRELGFKIEVDDFGSGHASVVGLMKLKPDVMKLDRILVEPVVRDPTARVLIRNMIEMGRALDISVTAEGVETRKHATVMRSLGCDTFQGYYFARPVAFDNLRTYLRSLDRLTVSDAIGD